MTIRNVMLVSFDLLSNSVQEIVGKNVFTILLGIRWTFIEPCTQELERCMLQIGPPEYVYSLLSG